MKNDRHSICSNVVPFLCGYWLVAQAGVCSNESACAHFWRSNSIKTFIQKFGFKIRFQNVEAIRNQMRKTIYFHRQNEWRIFLKSYEILLKLIDFPVDRSIE